MEPDEAETHSFIIRYWLEERGDKDLHDLWRGRITHIPGGEQRLIEDPSDIPAVIRSYLYPTGS